MVASAFGFSVMALFVKLASRDLPTGELVLARAVVTLVASVVMLRRAGLPMWGTNRLGLALRGVLGFGGLASYYLSIGRIPLADATTIQNTVPVLTALLAWWLLRETVGWSTAIAIACGIGGVLLVTHPSGEQLDPLGVGAGIAAAVFSAFAYVTVRQLARTEHPLVIVFYFPLIATPLAIPWAAATWVTPSPRDWIYLVALGLATQVGQVFLTLGLQLERAGRATSIGYVQVAFAMIWQWLVFAAPPTAWTLGGAALIFGGTLVVASVGAAARSAARSGPSPTPPARTA